jgi:hypothetical protein
MIIRTRKLPATQNDGERMRATADNGASLTIAFPYDATDPNLTVANMLAMAFGDHALPSTPGNHHTYFTTHANTGS